VLHGTGVLSEWVLNSPTAFATWSKDERTAVLVAIRWHGHGRIGNPASSSYRFPLMPLQGTDPWASAARPARSLPVVRRRTCAFAMWG
jgi:hypothetical protein